jgi:hypothetical protein
MIRIFGFVYGRLTETQSLGRHVASRGHILVANQPWHSDFFSISLHAKYHEFG